MGWKSSRVLEKKVEMNTLEYILKKFNLSYSRRTQMPLELPNYGRNNLAELFYELGFTSGVEIGAEAGVYSEILCKANPNLKLYSVDPWKIYGDYRNHVDEKNLQNAYEKAKVRLAPYNCELIKAFSMDAVKLFEDDSLDFVYIDGNHDFPNVTNDIHEWSKKIRKGGIVSGHDFMNFKSNRDKLGHETRMHVCAVVPAYTRAYEIRPWFVVGAQAKIPGTIRDTSRSWMWVKL
jgi:hypothetical protein